MNLAGGDHFLDLRFRSDEHQREHGCGLHNAGGPQMQFVSMIARVANAKTILDLGCGLGYSTLWLARGAGSGAEIIGIDDDPAHTKEAQIIAAQSGYGESVTFLTGRVADVLPTLVDPVDMIHDDAWFAETPAHLDVMLGLLRPGGVLTMANWFLLVDALTGEARNDWALFAGPDWASNTIAYAERLASRPDFEVTWLTNPPIGIATKR